MVILELCKWKEAGPLKLLLPHTSMRSCLDSYLFFFIRDGRGEFKYRGKSYELATMCLLTAGKVMNKDCQNTEMRTESLTNCGACIIYNWAEAFLREYSLKERGYNRFLQISERKNRHQLI